MYVKVVNAESLLKVAERKYTSAGMDKFLDSRMLENYKEVLKNIAHASNYAQGEMIKPSDLKNITRAVRTVINDVRFNLEKSMPHIPEDARTNLDTFRALLALDDYLYAMALKDLGCPYIPESFGEEHHIWLSTVTSLDEFEFKKEDYTQTTADNHYTQQRRKSAKTVRDNNSEKMSLIKKKMAPPMQVAKLLAEYQALTKRQEGHGDAWRFFHRKENAAREKLLQDMKEVLVSALGNDIQLEKADPLKMAQKYNSVRHPAITAEAFKPGGHEQRFRLPNGVTKYEPTSDERALNDPEKDNPFKNILTEEKFREIIRFPKEWFNEPVSNVPKQNGEIEENGAGKNEIEKEVDLDRSDIELNISIIN